MFTVLLSFLLAAGAATSCIVPVEAQQESKPPSQQKNGWNNPEPATPPPMKSDQAWAVPGGWNGVAYDAGSGEVFAVTDNGRVSRLNRDGKEIGTFTIKGSNSDIGALRLANLVGDSKPEVVVFRTWTGPVRAFDTTGKLIWRYDNKEGVDDVRVADLDSKDGDHHDEVLIGFNGGAGLHCLNSDGTLRWKTTGIGNVWNVTTGPFGPDQSPEVLAMLGNKIRFFDPSGKQAGDIKLTGEATMVRIANPAVDADPVVVVGGHDGLEALDRKGVRLWRIPIEGDPRSHIMDSAAAPDRPWLAVAMVDGRTLVYDVKTGARLAIIKTAGFQTLAWVPALGERPPLLLVASTGDLRAFTLVESKPKQ